MPTNRLIVKEQIATYTQLLFEAARNEGDAEYVLNVCGQAKELVKAIRGNADFEGALKDPGYTPEQKAQIVRGVFADAEPVLVNTVAVMVERGEIDYLPRVTEQLEDRIADELNLIIVQEEGRDRTGQEGGAPRARRQVPARRHHPEHEGRAAGRQPAHAGREDSRSAQALRIGR